MVMGMFVDMTDDSHFVYQLLSSKYLSTRDERLLENPCRLTPTYSKDGQTILRQQTFVRPTGRNNRMIRGIVYTKRF